MKEKTAIPCRPSAVREHMNTHPVNYGNWIQGGMWLLRFADRPPALRCLRPSNLEGEIVGLCAGDEHAVEAVPCDALGEPIELLEERAAALNRCDALEVERDQFRAKARRVSERLAEFEHEKNLWAPHDGSRHVALRGRLLETLERSEDSLRDPITDDDIVECVETAILSARSGAPPRARRVVELERELADEKRAHEETAEDKRRLFVASREEIGHQIAVNKALGLGPETYPAETLAEIHRLRAECTGVDTLQTELADERRRRELLEAEVRKARAAIPGWIVASVPPSLTEAIETLRTDHERALNHERTQRRAVLRELSEARAQIPPWAWTWDEGQEALGDAIGRVARMCEARRAAICILADGDLPADSEPRAWQAWAHEQRGKIVGPLFDRIQVLEHALAAVVGSLADMPRRPKASVQEQMHDAVAWVHARAGRTITEAIDGATIGEWRARAIEAEKAQARIAVLTEELRAAREPSADLRGATIETIDGLKIDQWRARALAAEGLLGDGWRDTKERDRRERWRARCATVVEALGYPAERAPDVVEIIKTEAPRSFANAYKRALQIVAGNSRDIPERADAEDAPRFADRLAAWARESREQWHLARSKTWHDAVKNDLATLRRERDEARASRNDWKGLAHEALAFDPYNYVAVRQFDARTVWWNATEHVWVGNVERASRMTLAQASSVLTEIARPDGPHPFLAFAPEDDSPPIVRTIKSLEDERDAWRERAETIVQSIGYRAERAPDVVEIFAREWERRIASDRSWSEKAERYRRERDDARRHALAADRVRAAAEHRLAERGVSLRQIAEASARRLPAFGHEGPDGSDWSALEWAGAQGGEVGELVDAVGRLLALVAAAGRAANASKKVRRGDLSIEDARAEVGAELADVILYGFALARRLGIDLERAVVAKFNAVSERIGSAVRLPEPIDAADPNPIADATPHPDGFGGSDY